MIIFLDFDGVLNSTAFYNSEEYLKSIEGMTDAEIMLVNPQLHLDPKTIQLINQLVDKTNCKLVVSSTWRYQYSKEELTELCKSRGGTFEFFDVTPNIVVNRGEEIQNWIDSNHYVGKFFAIDDDWRMKPIEEFWIQTDINVGLTQEHIDLIIRKIK